MTIDEVARKKLGALRLIQEGEPASAYKMLEELTLDTPNDPQVWHYLGIASAMLGQSLAAESALREALKRGSTSAVTHYTLGSVLAEQEKYHEAIAQYQQACKIKPDMPEAINNLGLAYMLLGAYDNAIQFYKDAVAFHPHYAEAHNNLGAAYAHLGKHELAVFHYNQAILGNPDLADAYTNLGHLYTDLGENQKALDLYLDALRIQPSNVEFHIHLGILHANQGNYSAAKASLERAIAINPSSAEAHNNLGRVYAGQGNLAHAKRYYQKSIELRPEQGVAHNNLAALLQLQGLILQAHAEFTIAKNNNPTNSDFASNYLLNLNYYHDLSETQIFDEHVSVGTAICEKIKSPPHAITPNIQRDRLRVGYVSPDFCGHSVSFFIEAILKQHTQQVVEVFCYSATLRVDKVTERLKQVVPHWQDIRGMHDKQIAELIRRDRIDILVDLAGHTRDNSLPVFAHQAAPIQVTYLGYPNTTGLSTMDYRLTDLEADPIGQEAFHTEQLVRLPHGFLCYIPPLDAPEVTALPALTAGHITFGSFNNLSKMTSEVIGLWVRILKAVPGSRLIIKNKSMKDGPTRARYLTLFREAGIEEERLDLVAWIPEVAGHLGAYARVDIALDTFPYNGTTTTCEALWMGVPVISLAGDRHAARVGVSLLTRVGLTELIAQKPEEYVKRAVELAGDTERLVTLRAGMRERMKHSPLCDAKSFTRDLEEAYREMWRTWCGHQQPG